MTHTTAITADVRETLVAALYAFLLKNEGIADDDSELAEDLFEMANGAEYAAVEWEDGRRDGEVFLIAAGEEAPFHYLAEMNEDEDTVSIRPLGVAKRATNSV